MKGIVYQLLPTNLTVCVCVDLRCIPEGAKRWAWSGSVWLLSPAGLREEEVLHGQVELGHKTDREGDNIHLKVLQYTEIPGRA